MNNQAAHTPGPWKVMPGTSAPRICVDGDKGWPIVVVISGHNDKAIKANERLIAAAPELLTTIEFLVDQLETHIRSEYEGTRFLKGMLADLKPAKDLIAKVKGKDNE
jgi:hypothetical protein